MTKTQKLALYACETRIISLIILSNKKRLKQNI